MKRVLCIALLSTGLAWGEDPLASKNWDAAVPALQARERNGESGSKLFYNLGLSYQQLNDLGRARAYYEGSLRRNSWNPSLQKNLALLKAQLAEPEPEENWLRTARHCAPPAFLAVLMVLTSWAACALAWMYRRHPRERWLWGGLTCLVLAILSSGLWLLARLQPTQATILPEMVQLMNGPGGEFTQSVKLQAGNLVDVVGEQGDWIQVNTLDNVEAWVRRDQLQWVP